MERHRRIDVLPDREAAPSARSPETVLAPRRPENLVADGIGGGLVRCSVFRLDGRPMSWRIDYLLGGTLYLGFCAIDEGQGRHSPAICTPTRASSGTWRRGASSTTS